MRRWVEYNFLEDRITHLNKNRLFKSASIFLEACKDVNGNEIEEIKKLYAPYVQSSLSKTIDFPQYNLPNTYSMKERLLPKRIEDALISFRIALESRPAIYDYLDSDTLYHHREKFIKEENGRTYIFEYFEDDE